MKIWIMSLAFLFVPLSAWGATTYYVATTGNDANPGTQASPWANPQKCVQAPVVAGDICLVGDGTYTDTDGNGIVISTFSSTLAGSAGSPVTVKSLNKWGAILTVPNTTLAGGNIGVYLNKDFFIIDGFEITGGTNNAGLAYHGIVVAKGNGSIVRNNKIHHIGRTVCSNSGSGFTGFFIGNPTGNTQVTNLTLDNNQTYSIGRLRNGESGCSTTMFQNDHAHYIDGTGATTPWTGIDGLTIDRGLCYDSNRGFCLQFFGTGGTSQNVHVWNMTFADASPTGSPAGQIMLASGMANVDFKNIISSNPATATFNTFSLTASNVSIDYVLTSSGDTDMFVPAVPSGVSFGANNLKSTSPGFVNAAIRDYSFAAGSAAIDSGVDVGLGGCTGTCDRGYFEYDTDVTAATCENKDGQQDVQTAIDMVASIGTVHIPAGTCTWTTSVHLKKQVSFQGAGKGVTTIVNKNGNYTFTNNCNWKNSCGWAALLFVAYDGAYTGPVEVTGITFKLPTVSSNSGYLIFVTGNGIAKFRIHDIDCSYQNTTDANTGIRCVGDFSDDAGKSYHSGLVDHVTCSMPDAGGICFNSRTAVNAGSQMWTHPFELGTNKSTYFENNTCTFTTGTGDGCWDMYDAASYVARYNTVIRGETGNHGVDSSFYSQFLVEQYRNTFTNAGVHLGFMGNPMRGTLNIMFENKATGLYDHGTIVQIYRSDPAQVANGNTGSPCVNETAYDGNLGTVGEGNLGYPCKGQVGWHWAVPVGCNSEATCGVPNGANVVYNPAYIWGERVNNAPTDIHNNPPPYDSSYAHINAATAPSKIDIYTDVGASCVAGGACTVGVGIGTTLPTTCVVGTAFWKTNAGTWNTSSDGRGSGQLFTCTATDTMTFYYEPYTYPHPLQGSGGGSDTTAPAAPTGIRIL